MTDPRHHSATEPDYATTGAPRWVKVFGIVALVVLLLFVTLLFVGGGHGPGRHTRSDDGAGRTPPPGVTHGEQRS